MHRRRELPPLNALRSFEAAARHLSFTKSARELGVTQAAVSHQVKALEDFLGCRLFERRTRALSLTDEGRALLPVATHAFASVLDATVMVCEPARAKERKLAAFRAWIASEIERG